MSKKHDDAPPERTTLATALSLAKLGWPVFPIKSEGKRPLVKWHGEATTDHEQITIWWAIEHPDALIGVHAGRAGLVIVDIDEKDGRSGSANLEAAGITWPKTFTQTTRSGGTHLYFTAPDDVELTIAQNHPVDAVDIRSGTGYAVYYGQPLTKRPKLAPAPEWSLKRKAESASGDYANASATVEAWLARTRGGAPTKAVKKAAKKVTRDGMGREAMLHAVSGLVKLGREPGIADAYRDARATYIADYPDFAREWDNAAEGSVKKFGLPPMTFPITKRERKALARRHERATVKRAEKSERAPVDAELTGIEIDDADLAYLDDAHVAEVVAERLAPLWGYVEGLGVMRYDGIVWKPAEDQALTEACRVVLMEFVRSAVRRAMREDDKASIPTAITFNNGGRINSVRRLVAGMLAERGRTPNDDPALLNVQNGYVDLRTGELHEHDADLFFTRVTGAPYDPNVTSELWDVTTGAFASPKVARWMQIRFGQALTGYTPDDAVLPINKGSGENGKSTVFDAIRSAAGTYAVTVPKRLLMSNPGDHPTELTTLMGARLAVLEELPDGRTLDVTRLKDVLGTRTLTARKVHRDDVSWISTHSLFITTNYTPLVNETDHGTWRRLALVDYPWRFRKPSEDLETKRDRHGDPRLKTAFETPDPAVLAWMIQGAVEWFALGMTMPEPPKRVQRDTADWRYEADPVMAFARERLVIDARYAIPVRQLANEFNHFLEERSQKRWGDQTVASRFANHVALPSVTRRKVRYGASASSKSPLASMPLMTMQKAPATGQAFVGIRFRDDPNALPPSSEPGEFERIVAGLDVGAGE